MENVQQIFTNVLHVLNSVPPDVWDMVAEVVFSAVVISPLALGLKKWKDVNSEKIMTAIVILGSFASAALLYFRDQPEYAAWFIIVQGWLTFATTQPVYFYFVKPLFRRMSAWFAAKVAQAAIVDTELRSAQEPAGGLQVNVKQVPPELAAVTGAQFEDFSQ